MTAYLDIVEKHLEVTFDFDPEFLQKMKSVPGARFKGTPYPHYRMQLDIESAKILREKFGEALVLRPDVRKWAKKIIKETSGLRRISQATTAELKRLPKVLPELYRDIHIGPRGKIMTEAQREAAMQDPPSYQAADVLYMAKATNPMNFNQPRTGKTLEAIAAVYEEGREAGPKLIVAPLTSLETVWEAELTRRQPQPILSFSGSKYDRMVALEAAADYVEFGGDFWLVVNPESFCYRRDWSICEDHATLLAEGERVTHGDKTRCEECALVLRSDYPMILGVRWGIIIADEVHKWGLGNPETLSYQTFEDLNAEKKIVMTGTPMGGIVMKLFGMLSLLHPKVFTSKWRFAEQWCEIRTDTYEKQGQERDTRVIEGLRPDREEAFYQMLSAYAVRRTREEVFPWILEKDPIEIEVTMTGRQKEQYEEFALDAEIRIDEEHLSATSILAEYTRLKQFAMAEQTIIGRDPKTDKPILRPTTNSCKLPQVYMILDEMGLGEGGAGERQVVIFSQFSTIVDMVQKDLSDHGYAAEKLSGPVPTKKRGELQRDFQAGKFKILVMTTTAGGVAITLDRADTVIFLDETWNPDDQEQAGDRVFSASPDHHVTIYKIRTKKTIEQYIAARVFDKSQINKKVLDLRRKGLRATDKATH